MQIKKINLIINFYNIRILNIKSRKMIDLNFNKNLNI